MLDLEIFSIHKKPTEIRFIFNLSGKEGLEQGVDFYDVLSNFLCNEKIKENYEQ